MDSLLNERWLAGSPFLSIVDDACVSLAREQVRAVSAELGLSTAQTGELAIVVSELATNQLRHVGKGRIAVRTMDRGGVPGVEIVAADTGLGIHDPTTALAGVPRGSGSLGIGLSSVLRLSHEVDFDVRLGEGTCIWTRTFAERVSRRREVAVLSRPIGTDPLSGDDAVFVRDERRLLLAVADGLGHGPEAREASHRAIAILMEHGHDPLEAFEHAHRDLVSTRGAVMTVVEVDEADGVLGHAAVGNVTAQVVHRDTVRGFGAPALVLGMPGTQVRKRVRRENATVSARDVVLLFSDGFTTRTRLDPNDTITTAHPLCVAHQLLQRFGRDSDDATIVVAF